MTTTSRTPGRARNPRGSGALLREEIVAAATRLLRDRAAEAVTLRAIAREAGITAPSIYTHFQGVQEIFHAVVEQTFTDLEHVLRDAGDGRDPVSRIHAIATAYLAFAKDHPEEYRLLFGGAWNAAELPADAGARLHIEALGLEALQVLADAVRACAEEGSSTSGDPDADAVALWVGLHGLAGLRRTTPLFAWPADMESSLVRTLARLTPRP